MKIIIPLAGQGSRFSKSGFNEIKPLIEIEAKPMIAHVVEMFPKDADFIFICQNEHLRNTRLEEVLNSLRPCAKVIGIQEHNLGPVYSVLAAAPHLQDDEEVIVNYCDYFTPWDYRKFKSFVVSNNSDACLSAYTGFHPHLLREGLYAGIRIGEDRRIKETKEKYSFTLNKMDSYHSAGAYYFKKGSYIKKYFTRLIAKKMQVKGEYYVSSACQLMLDDGLLLHIYDLEYFLQWGTPEDLKDYLFWSNIFACEFRSER